MSRVIVSLGSLRISSQVHRFGLSTSPVIEKVQSVSGVRGVGPADMTRKSRTRYWPGGRRPDGVWSLGRPRNARETKVIFKGSSCATGRFTLRQVKTALGPSTIASQVHGAL